MSVWVGGCPCVCAIFFSFFLQLAIREKFAAICPKTFFIGDSFDCFAGKKKSKNKKIREEASRRGALVGSVGVQVLPTASFQLGTQATTRLPLIFYTFFLVFPPIFFFLGFYFSHFFEFYFFAPAD